MVICTMFFCPNFVCQKYQSGYRWLIIIFVYHFTHFVFKVRTNKMKSMITIVYRLGSAPVVVIFVNKCSEGIRVGMICLVVTCKIYLSTLGLTKAFRGRN